IVMGLTNNCAPPCLLEDLSVSTNCLNDSTFEVLVSFSGAGNTYTLSDNQGTPALSGLSAGTYTYGSYPSGTQVVIAVQDENSSLCRLLSPVVTADCAPPKPCDLELLSAEAVCLNGSSFEVHISIGGTGQAFTLTDNQGSAPLTGLSAGTYILGPYPSQSIVIFTLTDPEAANCSLTEALTADCTLPPPDNDLCSAATPIACGDVVQGRTDGATDVGVCGFCGTHADAPGVWYELIGTGDSVRIEVCGDYDTRLNVYEFGCDTLSCVTGNDAADLPGCEGGSAVSFATVAGEPYLIYVNGTAGAVGTFSLSVHCASEAPAARLSAEVVARQVQLNWELSQAQEIGQVQLERSQDLTHFQPLCRFEGAMQPKGAFTDEGVKANQRYFYRLRYQPRHGSTTYSSMLGVWVPGLQASLGEFYPNPATSLTRLTLFSPAVGKGKWQLQDQAGNVLASGNFDVAAGNQALNLPVPKLPEGVYLVRFALDGKWIGSRKLNVVN
ncbi:MAG: T9SS C-terminal target domain-containing protein, partial [Bacteroidetes bacterium]